MEQKTFKEYLVEKRIEQVDEKVTSQQKIDFMKEVRNQMIVHKELLEKLKYA